MNFINDNYLYFLLFGLIPIIIHYLMRFRSVKVNWGANYVLQRALERLKKKLYWEQFVLIALRVLACLLIVLAFARPISKQKSDIVTNSGVQHVIILDGSYSMLADTGKTSLWDQSKKIAENLLKTWGRGESWSLLFLKGDGKWIVADEKISTYEESLEKIKDLKPAEASSSITQALKKVFDRYGSAPLDVYIFADNQSGAWKNIQTLTKPSKATVYWINPGLENCNNVAVNNVYLASQRSVVDHPNRIYATVKNYGTETINNQELECLVDGNFLARETVSIIGGQEVTMSFPVTFSKPGSHSITIRLSKDTLNFDNTLSAAIDVAESFNILVLNNNNKKKQLTDSIWGALDVANQLNTIKNEDEETIYDKGLFNFTNADSETLPNLDEYDAVILDGARKLTPALAVSLSTYVKNGGGLILAPDAQTDASIWNSELSKTGILPAKLGTLNVEVIGGERCQKLDLASFTKGSLASFSDGKLGDLGKSKFYSWFSLKAIPNSTVAQGFFKDKTPFLLHKKLGQGNVLMTTAALNGQGNNMIVKEFFLPFVYGLISQSAEGRKFPRTIKTGERIQLRVKDPESYRAVTFNIPEQEPIPVKVGEKINYPDGSPVSGLCSLLLVKNNGNERIWFGVQGDRVDSDLTPLPANDNEFIVDKLQIKELNNWNALQQQLQQKQTGHEFFALVIIALLLVLGSEMLLQRRFV